MTALAPCIYRHGQTKDTTDLPIIGCYLMDNALGWPHQAGENLCARCFAYHKGALPPAPTHDGQDPLSRLFFVVFLSQLVSPIHDANLKIVLGSNRDELISRAKTIGFAAETIRGRLIDGVKKYQINSHHARQLIKAHSLGPVEIPEQARPRRGGIILRDSLARVQQYKDSPCDHINLLQPNFSHTCRCGVVYPCTIYGQCVISLRNDLAFRSCLYCADYSPKKPQPKIFNRVRTSPLRWAVGVTVAPRPETSDRFKALAQQYGWPSGPAIESTLLSLQAAGFTDVQVFAEPGSHHPAFGYSQWFYRPEPFGAWKNWKAALHQLCHDFPDAEAILLSQDDVLYSQGTREFLDATLWPDNCGAISLYCSARYASNAGLLVNRSGSGFWGACAFVFSRESALAIINSTIPETLSGNKIDNRVGLFCSATSKNLWVYSPSLTQHIGEFRSALNHGGGGGMRASNFLGESFDARTLIAMKHKISIALPVFGCGDLTAKCINHLAQFCQNKSELTLYLVDDRGPPDDFIQAFNAAEASGIPWRIIRNENNEGFTSSINKVIAAAAEDHILILNSDAFICNDVPSLLLEHISRDHTIGVVGSMEYRLDTIGPHNDIRKRPSHAHWVSRLPSDFETVAQEMLTANGFENHSVLSYFCVLINRAAINAIGGLNSVLADGLAADNEHCDRLLSGNWKVGIAHDALALHQGSASFRAAALPREQMRLKAVAKYRQIQNAR